METNSINIIENRGLRVLAENNKYQSFNGISRSVRDDIIQLYFDDETFLELTSDHKVLSNNRWIEAKDTLIDDIFITPTGTKRLIYKDKSNLPTFVYDLINVDETKNFFASKSLISNCILLDEFAHIDNDVEFFESTYPVISSGKSTKVIITSTPKGMNLFYKLWTESEEGRNDFHRSKYLWYHHPDRDEAWRKETESNIGTQNFSQEYECVDADTTITLKRNNVEFNTKIGDLYNTLNRNNTIQSELNCVKSFEINDDILLNAAYNLAFNHYVTIAIVVKKSKTGYDIISKIMNYYNQVSSDCLFAKYKIKKQTKSFVNSEKGVTIYTERLNRNSFRGRTINSAIVDSNVIDDVIIYQHNNHLICYQSKKMKKTRYSIHEENDIYLVYDSHQDIFINRFGIVDCSVFLTKSEANATIKFLNAKLKGELMST